MQTNYFYCNYLGINISKKRRKNNVYACLGSNVQGFRKTCVLFKIATHYYKFY